MPEFKDKDKTGLIFEEGKILLEKAKAGMSEMEAQLVDWKESEKALRKFAAPTKVVLRLKPNVSKEDRDNFKEAMQHVDIAMELKDGRIIASAGIRRGWEVTPSNRSKAKSHAVMCQFLERFGMKSGVHFKIEWGAANKENEGANVGNGLRLMKLGGDDGGRPIEVARVMSDSKKPGGGWVLQETFKLLRNSWEQTELATLQSEICQI